MKIFLNPKFLYLYLNITRKMKYLNLLKLGLLSFILISCSTDNTKKVTAFKGKRNLQVEYSIEETDMYDTTAISIALKSADRHQKTESRKYFLQGLDLLVNKNKPSESVEFFKESILYYPDEKNYLHLFKAYIYSYDTTNATVLSQFIESQSQKWGMEYYETDYNNALLAGAKMDAKLCVIKLMDAYMNGFVFKERITEEPLFKFMEDDLNFQSFIAANFGSDEKLTRAILRSFVSYYPDLELPYMDSVQAFNYDQYIDYNYSSLIPGMDDGRFSRDVSNEYMYVGKTKLENGYAFIYKSYMAIADTLNPVKAYVITYDSLGTMVANEMIGCFCSPTESKGFTINKDLSITITDYQTNWETDPIENGYAGNKIKSVETVGKTILMIQNNGALKPKEDEVATASAPKD